MIKLGRKIIRIVVIVIVWMAAHIISQSSSIPSPVSMVENIFYLFIEQDMFNHIAHSIMRLGLAMILAVIVGSVIGIVMGTNKRIDCTIGPIIYLLYPVPKVALLPVIFMTMGLGEASKIFMLWLILVFPVTITVRDSINKISQEIFISAKSLGLSKRGYIYHVIIPAVLPDLFTVLRMNIGTGMAVLFFSEGYATKYGLGYFILDKWSLIEYLDMYSGIIIMGIIGYGLFVIFEAIEMGICKWKSIEVEKID